MIATLALDMMSYEMADPRAAGGDLASLEAHCVSSYSSLIPSLYSKCITLYRGRMGGKALMKILLDIGTGGG